MSDREAAFEALTKHFNNDIQGTNIAEHWLDKKYFKNSMQALEGLSIDFSRHHANRDTWKLLFDLARACKLKDAISHLYSGYPRNFTEEKPALHMALRASSEDIDFKAIYPNVQDELNKLETWVSRLHSGDLKGYSGNAIDTVVNLGVGGSDLGPLLVSDALKGFREKKSVKLSFHYVSSMEGSQTRFLLATLDPERTLFLVTSKSFGTIDTLVNAATFLAWLLEHCQDKSLVLDKHFLAITGNSERAKAWGIPEENHLKFWSWVGGRFSLWSTIGTSVAMQLGMKQFRELLAGANSMDRHFKTEPWEKNLPIRLALIGIWCTNILGIESLAVLPYDGRLKLLPTYLQQLEMESNGKSVNSQGQEVDYETAPIIWGELGPNGQHAFFQLLHQGTRSVACDFILTKHRYLGYNGPLSVKNKLTEQHKLGLSNCLAQAMVLALGDKALGDSNSSEPKDKPSYQNYPGNQPSNLIMLDELTPRSLGQLIALYEHKVFTQSVIWDINPFDQWGVELGKVMASGVLSAFNGGDQNFDEATKRSITLLSDLKGT